MVSWQLEVGGGAGSGLVDQNDCQSASVRDRPYPDAWIAGGGVGGVQDPGAGRVDPGEDRHRVQLGSDPKVVGAERERGVPEPGADVPVDTGRSGPCEREQRAETPECGREGVWERVGAG